jgi:hypothetical protein
MLFNVEVPELHISTRQVEADSLEEAYRLVNTGEDDGKELSVEFKRTLEAENSPWHVVNVATRAGKEFRVSAGQENNT